MSGSAGLFEKIAHPTRIRILKLLDRSPMTFGRLKDELGIASSGNLDHYIKKLEGLVVLDSDGLYRLSDEGKEALAAVRIVESTISAGKEPTSPQTRWVMAMYGTVLGAFWLALIVTAASAGAIGLSGGLIGGAIGGSVGGLYGLWKGMKAEARTNQPLTFWPNRSSPWQAGDWAAQALFLGGQIASIFCVFYAWLRGGPGENFLWFVGAGLSILVLVVGSAGVMMKTIARANRLVDQPNRS
jgi:DNA-binding transcriptional ArsR family regulator